jgi:hypothetical protein
MTSDTKIHWLNLRALLEQTRKNCEAYDDPLLIELKVGGKTFMKMTKAALSSPEIDSEAFEEAIKSDSSLGVVVSRWQ